MTCGTPIDLSAVTAVFAHSADEVLIIDSAGFLLWANPKAIDALGGGAAVPPIGVEWAALWDGDAAELVRRSYGHAVPVATHFAITRGRGQHMQASVVPLDHDGLHHAYVVTLRDDSERVRFDRSRALLLEEMRHRQGNTLALASSLLTVHAQTTPEAGGFAEEMSMRLAALGRAQKVVATQEDGEEDVADVANLVEVLVRPLIGPRCDLVIDVEPGIVLPSSKIDVVAMVLSELAVNSAKHGAFLHGGRLALSVVRTDDGIEFAWQERSDEGVAARQRDGGMGQRLMTRLADVNDGAYEVAWRPRGQLARLLLHDAQDGPARSVA